MVIQAAKAAGQNPAYRPPGSFLRGNRVGRTEVFSRRGERVRWVPLRPAVCGRMMETGRFGRIEALAAVPTMNPSCVARRLGCRVPAGAVPLAAGRGVTGWRELAEYLADGKRWAGSSPRPPRSPGGDPLRYELSDLSYSPPGLSRLRHGLAGQSRVRFLRRAAQVGTEVALAGLMDRLRPLRAEILRAEAGIPASSSGCLCLYTHWSPNGRVSDMVLRQMDAWRAQGFDIVFVSNAVPPAADWDRLAAHCVLRISRDNIGRDFGAWRDALAIVLDRLGPPRELLLANDSVLGPIRDLAPVVAALRAGGEGLFGLTESRGGGAHLQSYVLLARGEGAVAEVGRHLADRIPSRSKWRLVQQGEIGLTRRMLEHGHRVAALFGHDRVGTALDHAMLREFGARFAEVGAYDRYPLNPTHHLWRVLVEKLGFPYIKTELVLRNPGRLAGVEAWRDVVDADGLPLIERHLAVMRGG